MLILISYFSGRASHKAFLFGTYLQRRVVYPQTEGTWLQLQVGSLDDTLLLMDSGNNVNFCVDECMAAIAIKRLDTFKKYIALKFLNSKLLSISSLEKINLTIFKRLKFCIIKEWDLGNDLLFLKTSHTKRKLIQNRTI